MPLLEDAQSYKSTTYFNPTKGGGLKAAIQEVGVEGEAGTERRDPPIVGEFSSRRDCSRPAIVAKRAAGRGRGRLERSAASPLSAIVSEGRSWESDRSLRSLPG